MLQSRLHAETTEQTARTLLSIYEVAFEENGYAVAAFEKIEQPEFWEISVYVETELAQSVQSQMVSLAKNADIEIRFEREDIPETNWVAQTLRELAPVRAGRFIVHGTHDQHIPKSHEFAVLVDAGLAFGTGHHGTTAGCLDMLDLVLKRKIFSNILDLGTGSGVLAIACAKAMPTRILATDIDPVATETAKYNAQRNGVQGQIECVTSAGFTNHRLHEQAPYDLVIANILARPLQSMAHDLACHTAGGCTVILSGLLPHQRAPLVASFRLQGLHLERYHIRDGWLILVLYKP